MSLPSRDYYIKIAEKKSFLRFKEGQMEFTQSMHKAFNFHSHDQAVEFIEYLKCNVAISVVGLEVYRY